MHPVGIDAPAGKQAMSSSLRAAGALAVCLWDARVSSSFALFLQGGYNHGVSLGLRRRCSTYLERVTERHYPRSACPRTGDGDHVVIVFNNDYNTYDEVIAILQAATGCSREEAEMETWEIDHLGRSLVHYGQREECERAAAIIRIIGIRVSVSEL